MRRRPPAPGGVLDSADARAELEAGRYLTFRYSWAPAHLLTRRQLAARGLRPGGQAPVAEIRWRGGARVAYLYDSHRALPKRTATPAVLDALDRAMAARRRCRTCGRHEDYCVPLSTQQCSRCMDPAPVAA